MAFFHPFCYNKIKACNGVNLRNIKPIKAEIIDGELYDLETEEHVYKVIPKIEEVNIDEFNDYTNKTNINNESILNTNKSSEL